MTARTPRRLSFSTLGTPGRSVSQLIELAQRFAIGGIDLRLAEEGGELRPGMPAAEVQRLGQTLRDAGLEVPSLYCYCRPEPAAARWQTAYREELGRLLELGAAVGAGYIRSFGAPVAARGPRGFSDGLLGDVAAAVLNALEAEGFDGYVSLNWEKRWHPELPDIEVALGRFVDLFRG